MKFLENATLEAAFVPVDMQTGANAGDWVSLENYERCIVVLYKGIGTAGDDPVFKLQQAKTSAGGTSKNLDFTEIYSKVGSTAVSGVTAWTETTQAADTSFTDATSAENEAFIVVEVKADDLDVSNDYKFVQLSVADVGSNAQIGCGFYILLDPRYPQATIDSALS